MKVRFVIKVKKGLYLQNRLLGYSPKYRFTNLIMDFHKITLSIYAWLFWCPSKCAECTEWICPLWIIMRPKTFIVSALLFFSLFFFAVSTAHYFQYVLFNWIWINGHSLYTLCLGKNLYYIIMVYHLNLIRDAENRALSIIQCSFIDQISLDV